MHRKAFVAAMRRLLDPPRLSRHEGSMVPATPTWQRALGAALFFLAAWLFVFPYFERLNNPNENVRLYMTSAIVETGGYEISQERQRWGWVNDAACVERGDEGTIPCDGVARGTRSYYSVKAPLTSVLGVPGYWIARQIEGGPPSKVRALWWVRLFGTALPCVIFLFFFYRFLGAITRSPKARDMAYVGLAFGSVFLGYSYIFASHATSAAFAGGAFMMLAWFRTRPRSERFRTSAFEWLLTALAGFLAAGVTALEYPCFFFSVALCVYALMNVRPWPRLLAFGLGALVPTLLVAHFQYAAFDNPLSPGHLFVENPAFRSIHDEGFFGADKFRGEAALSLLFSPREGLFWFTPLFLFALPGVGLLWRRHRRGTLVALSATLITYLAVCFLKNWDGGWVIGPRYLVVILPFVAMATAAGIERAQHARPAWTEPLAATLLVISLLVAGSASVLFPHVPPEIELPIAHLFWPLLEAGRAPHTAAELVGVRGLLALVPLLAITLLLLRWSAGRWRVRVWLGSLAFCAALAFSLTFVEQDPSSAAARANIEALWEPN